MANVVADTPSIAVPAKRNPGSGMGCLVAIVIVIVLAIIGSVMGSDDNSSSTSGGRSGGSSSGGDDSAQEELNLGAFDVCKDFVRDRLKAPSSATFRNFFEDDGEVVVNNVGEEYTVISSVDAENSFGAKIRNDFVCIVTHTGGQSWRLKDIALT